MDPIFRTTIVNHGEGWRVFTASSVTRYQIGIFMTTGSKNPSIKRVPESNALKGPDAIAMLLADHDKVKDLFKQFEELMDQEDKEEQKEAVAQKVCDALKIHAQFEEEIFYPAARVAIEDDDLMDDADIEHEAITELIEQIEAMHPSDDLYDAKVVVLGETVEDHVIEEEGEMFPLVKKSKTDTVTLGALMLERKKELMAELGVRDESVDISASTRTKKINPAQGRTLS